MMMTANNFFNSLSSLEVEAVTTNQGVQFEILPHDFDLVNEFSRSYLIQLSCLILNLIRDFDWSMISQIPATTSL